VRGIPAGRERVRDGGLRAAAAGGGGVSGPHLAPYFPFFWNSGSCLLLALRRYRCLRRLPAPSTSAARRLWARLAETPAVTVALRLRRAAVPLPLRLNMKNVGLELCELSCNPHPPARRDHGAPAPCLPRRGGAAGRPLRRTAGRWAGTLSFLPPTCARHRLHAPHRLRAALRGVVLSKAGGASIAAFVRRPGGGASRKLYRGCTEQGVACLCLPLHVPPACQQALLHAFLPSRSALLLSTPAPFSAL